MKRLATIVVLGLMMGVALRMPAHAGGGGSAASSPTGHALAGKIQRLKLEAARAESEALKAHSAVLQQAAIEVQLIKMAANVVGILAKTYGAVQAGIPVAKVIRNDVSMLALDIAILASDVGEE